MLERHNIMDIATLMKHGYRFNKIQEKQFTKYFIEHYCNNDRTLNVASNMQTTIVQLKKAGFIFPDNVMRIMFFSFDTMNNGNGYIANVGQYQRKNEEYYNEYTVERYRKNKTAEYYDMLLEYYHNNTHQIFKTWLFLCQEQAIQPVAQTYYVKLFLKYYLEENTQYIEMARNALLKWSKIKNLSSYISDELKQCLTLIGGINIDPQIVSEEKSHMKDLIKLTKKIASTEEENNLSIHYCLKNKNVPVILQSKLSKIEDLYDFLLQNKEQISTEDWIMIEKLASLRVSQIIKKYVLVDSLNLFQDEDNTKNLCIQALDNIQSYLEEKIQHVRDENLREIKVLVRYTNQLKK